MDTLKKLERNGVYLKYEDVMRICQKYHLSELSIFGSALRDDFNEESDVDILVSWANYRKYNKPFDFIEIEDDLRTILKRDVDVIEKEALDNPIRREDILASCEVVYVAK